MNQKIIFKLHKDDFKRFKKCPKLMWLMRNRFDNKVFEWCSKNVFFLNKEENKKFKNNFKFDSKNNQKINSELEIRMINGIKFEEMVIKYFSNLYNSFSFDELENKYNFSNKKIKKFLDDKKWDVFYHPIFKFENYSTECDILKRNKDGFDIYEVKGKGNSGIKTDKKDLINDLLYQNWILKKLGYKIKNCYIVHINSDYIHFKKMNFKELISINDSFNFSKYLNINIEHDLMNAYDYLKLSWNEIKIKLIKSFCLEDDLGYCTHIIPKIESEHNITHLYRLKRTQKAKIISENNQNEINLLNFDENKYKFIKEKHYRQIKVVKGIEKNIKNIKESKKILEDYIYPIYFYDFETCPFAIPKFENSNPYLQIPFQYSVHVLLNKDYDLKTNKNIKHYEFIIDKNNDPRINFGRNFSKTMSKHGKGSYVAYSVSFERSILKKIIDLIPNKFSLEEMDILEIVKNNSIDLMDFFKNFNIYFKNFKGSLSIKSTLPALNPNFSYKNLKIQSGDQALAIYYNYINGLVNELEWKEITNDLKKYCGLDSLAMVIIFDKIKNLINKY